MAEGADWSSKGASSREGGRGWLGKGRGAGAGGLSCGHWSWLENTGGHMWGGEVRHCRKKSRMYKRCLVVPETVLERLRGKSYWSWNLIPGGGRTFG